MTLLFVTQKLHTQDAFGNLWIQGFINRGYTVIALCLEDDGKPRDFAVYSMGKEKEVSKLQQVLTFWKLICTLKYDRVFIHMSPVWGGLGAWWWMLVRKPVYLWYTHYQMQWGLKVLGWYCKRMFCATAQSLPKYPSASSGQVAADYKKIVTGHGIDLNVWKPGVNTAEDPTKLVVVHRLSRSKRLELCIRALLHLPDEYTIDVYGIEAESDYVAELHALVAELHLQARVKFHGTVPMTELPAIYTAHRYILNMASETIDKTMLEAMTQGCYPVTTKRNAEAIGISEAPEDNPEGIARWLTDNANTVPLNADEMYEVVRSKHSLTNLMQQMDSYIREGN